MPPRKKGSRKQAQVTKEIHDALRAVGMYRPNSLDYFVNVRSGRRYVIKGVSIRAAAEHVAPGDTIEILIGKNGMAHGSVSIVYPDPAAKRPTRKTMRSIVYAQAAWLKKQAKSQTGKRAQISAIVRIPLEGVCSWKKSKSLAPRGSAELERNVVDLPKAPEFQPGRIVLLKASIATGAPYQYETVGSSIVCLPGSELAPVIGTRPKVRAGSPAFEGKAVRQAALFEQKEAQKTIEGFEKAPIRHGASYIPGRGWIGSQQRAREIKQAQAILAQAEAAKATPKRKGSARQASMFGQPELTFKKPKRR